MNASSALGQRFGKLILTRFFTKKTKWHNNESFWECRCDCGNTTEVSWANLRAGSTKSCGCARGDFIRNRKPKLTAEESVARRVQTSYILNARARDLPWELTFEQFFSLIFQPCHYCGVAGYSKQRAARRLTAEVVARNGIDRRDSSKGYVFDNCVSCCQPCNEAKSDRSLEWFREWATRLAANLNKGS